MYVDKTTMYDRVITQCRPRYVSVLSMYIYISRTTFYLIISRYNGLVVCKYDQIKINFNWQQNAFVYSEE